MRQTGAIIARQITRPSPWLWLVLAACTLGACSGKAPPPTPAESGKTAQAPVAGAPPTAGTPAASAPPSLSAVLGEDAAIGATAGGEARNSTAPRYKRRVGEPAPAKPGASPAVAMPKRVLGSASFSAPETGELDVPFTAIVEVSKGSLPDALREDGGEHSTTVTRPVKVTHRMWAGVSGFGFEVTPKEGYTQFVTEDQATKWSFLILPRQTGKIILQFEIRGVLEIDGQETPQVYWTREQPVVIPVTVRSILDEYRERILAGAGAALTALWGWLWTARRRRRREGDAPAPGKLRRRKAV